MKVAIVHDWLIGGGAERVVEALHKLYPESPIYTSYSTEEWRQKLDDKVVTGYLQHLGKARKYVPFLRGWWFSHLNLKDYDLIISSSGAEAKYVRSGARSGVGTLHVAYIHAPTHYYWDKYEEYLKNPGFPTGFNWLARLGLKLLIGPLRKWDYRAAHRPDVLLANSSFTQTKIKQYYGRDSEVVHPPVDLARFADMGKAERHGFVVVGRQTPYKRIDLAVAACTKLNLPLAVIGNGPEHKKLVAMAGPSVKFVSEASNEQVAQAVGSAEAFIFPNVDDFGISAVEALAAGTPVIAFKAGGALDYIVEGKTGTFFTEQTIENLTTCLQSFDSKKFSSDEIKNQAQSFSVDNFEAKMNSVIDKLGGANG